MPTDYCVTFACYNQLAYTQEFIASLDREEVDFSKIIAVDNGSTDGTREWLQTQGFGGVILNRQNLGCGAAWNQGALALQAEWTIVMNNDVVCGKGWLRGLLEQAQLQKLDIASPGMVEGNLDYDLAQFQANAEAQMNGYCRQGTAHAVCMTIHRSVWDRIGYFLPIPKLLGYEDAVFFRQAQMHGLKLGITSASWLHHYGMTTQKALKLEMNLQQKDSLGNRNLMKFFMNQSWLERKQTIHARRKLLAKAKEDELSQYGLTVHAAKLGPELDWL